jgi:hypothetical protein
MNRRHLLTGMGSGAILSVLSSQASAQATTKMRGHSNRSVMNSRPPSPTVAPVAPPLCNDLRAPLEPLQAAFRDAATNIARPVVTKPIDDGLTALVEPSDQFRYHQVEQLLSQTSTLLERGIASRMEWQSLGEKSIATWLELKEFSDLELIHADETAAGYYAMQPEQSSAAEHAEEYLQIAFSNVATALDNELSGPAGELNNTRLNTLVTSSQTANAGVDKDAIQDLTWHSFYLARDEASNQQSNYLRQADASKIRVDAAKSKSLYDLADACFRRRRTEAARRINAYKAGAYAGPNSAFNYEERRRVIQTRFQADFTDAMLRLATLSKGLSQIYGYKLPLGASSTPFDDALLAVRAAMEWLVRFSGLEQNYILPVSLESLSSNDWNAGLSDDGCRGYWQFIIPPEYFPDQAHVRLRGISAIVDAEGDTPLFQCALRVPEAGAIKFLDGSSHSLQQADLPTVRIGRVLKRDSMRPADIVGTLSLHNVSPIGQWKMAVTSSRRPIKLSDPLNPRQPTSSIFSGTGKLKDVILNLHLAVRNLA